jgi:hypothetical protein
MTGKVAVSWLLFNPQESFAQGFCEPVVYGKPLIPKGKDFVY